MTVPLINISLMSLRPSVDSFMDSTERYFSHCFHYTRLQTTQSGMSKSAGNLLKLVPQLIVQLV